MDEILETLKLNTTRSSTAATYYRVWKSFNQFVVKLDKVPNNWEQRLSLYLSYLVDSGTQSSSLKSYISAIKKTLLLVNHNLNFDMVLFNSLSKACKIRNDVVKIRRPIRTGLLDQLLFEMEHHFRHQYYLETLYKSIFILTYYGMLRIGEVTQLKHVLKAKNINNGTNKNKIMLILYSSKIHNVNVLPQKIKVSQTTGKEGKQFFCPFLTIRKFLHLRGPYVHDDEQFFIFQDRSPVKPIHVHNLLRILLKKLTLNADLYDCHSVRAGRASQLIKLGYTVDEVKRLGRWKSNAVYKYIKL